MRERFENPGVLNLSDEERKILLARLIRATRLVALYSIAWVASCCHSIFAPKD